MTATPHHLVFVDDDPHEIQTFRRLYEPRFSVTTVEAGTPDDGLEKAVASIGQLDVDLSLR